MTRGICYVAWGQQHINEAIASFRSRRIPLPGCLICDKPYPGTEIFDHTIVVDLDTAFADSHHYMKKWACLIHTPFDETLFMDTDCHLIASVDLGFSAGEFCLCHGLSHILWDGIREYIHYNTGVCFFKGRRPELFSQFMSVSRELNGKFIEDEWPVSVAIDRYKVPVTVLPAIFNKVHVVGKRYHDRVIRILHTNLSPDLGPLPNHLCNDINGHEFAQYK